MHTFRRSPDYPIPQSPDVLPQSPDVRPQSPDVRPQSPDVRPQSRDARKVASVGRSARLELSFGVRAGRTVLDHAYAEPPFRIGRAFDLHGAAYVIIVCS